MNDMKCPICGGDIQYNGSYSTSIAKTTQQNIMQVKNSGKNLYTHARRWTKQNGG